MKGKFRIGGALLVGILLILGAFVMSKSTTPTIEAGEVVVVAAPARDSLETKDLNNNGIADWKEDLGETVFETIQTPESKDVLEDKEYTPPTTLTGKFSVAFMQDYLQGKMSGETFDNPEQFIGGAIASIDRSIQSKKHSRLELTIVETTSESLRNYGNDLVEIILSHPNEGGEVLTIVQNALTQERPEILDKLVSFQNSYALVIDDMVSMNVPTALVEQHIKLLNRNERVYADLIAMQQTFNDPLYGLAHIRNFRSNVDDAADIVRSMLDILTKNEIVYSKNEPGAVLYIFDI